MAKRLEDLFDQYGEVIGAALAHADRRMPAQWYLRGLMLPGGRKSVEPMAARVQPHNVRSVLRDQAEGRHGPRRQYKTTHPAAGRLFG